MPKGITWAGTHLYTLVTYLSQDVRFDINVDDHEEY